MNGNELLHESFDYQDFFNGNQNDDYHTLTCLETIDTSSTTTLMQNTQENLGHVVHHSNGTLIKHRSAGNVLMATSTDEYFPSGINLINEQVIKSECSLPATIQYFNGNANQLNSNNHHQTFTFDNIVYNTGNTSISMFDFVEKRTLFQLFNLHRFTMFNKFNYKRLAKPRHQRPSRVILQDLLAEFISRVSFVEIKVPDIITEFRVVKVKKKTKNRTKNFKETFPFFSGCKVSETTICR